MTCPRCQQETGARTTTSSGTRAVSSLISCAALNNSGYQLIKNDNSSVPTSSPA